MDCSMDRQIDKQTHRPKDRVLYYISTGSVMIWDLKTQLPFLFSSSSSSSSAYCTLYPSIQISAHKGPCRSISWLPIDTKYLCTG